MSTYMKVRKYGGPVLLAAITVTAVISFLWFRGIQEGDGQAHEPADHSGNTQNRETGETGENGVGGKNRSNTDRNIKNRHR